LPNLGLGGAQRTAVHILRALDQSRFQPSVIVVGRKSGTQLETMLAERSVPVTFLGKGPGFDPRAYGWVFRALRRQRPHVLHTQMQVLLYALPAIRVLRIPLTVHTVQNLAEYDVGPALDWVQALAFRMGVIPVAIGRAVELSLQDLYGLSGIRVIPNAIPVSSYSLPAVIRNEWRAREGFSDDDFLIGSVGRLEAQKNYSALLETFAHLHRPHPRAKIVVAGDGSERSAIEARAGRLGIRPRVHFLGSRNDIPDFLAALDVFALSSDYEGNPLCIMEAMAAGLPIVSTSVGCVPELVRNGKEAFLVRRGDPSAMAGALELLLLNPALRRTMGAAAACRARNEFDVSKMAGAYAALYETAGDYPERRVREIFSANIAPGACSNGQTPPHDLV
jgi:glycosyltransferase involved in cell wall biosynthesis